MNTAVNLEENENEDESTLRDALSDAFDGEDEGNDGSAEGDDKTPPPEGDDKTPPPEGDDKTPPPEGDDKTPPPEGDDKTPPPEGEDKAPASWAPAEREEWAKVPESVKQVINKRETEVQKVMTESAQARQHFAAFNNMVTPFQGMFAAQGVQNPLQGVHSILQTSAQLQGGTSQDKATAIVGLIKQFGVDIKTLDDALVGNTGTASTTAQAADPRYDALNEKISGMERHFQSQEAQAQQTVNTETEQFIKSHDFANDLRGTMADFMDVAAKNGRPLSLDDAYNHAIATRPDIQQILANRLKTANAQKHTAQARNAGSSVPITSDGGGQAKQPENLRQAIAEAWETT